MTLVDMKQNKTYKIHKILTDDNVLRERLVALGICEGTEANLLQKSIDKATIAILANNSRIALRATEAREVSVEEIA
ncbi:hypothetical protein CCY99_08280 [Helicobacter sp. 16-1353]|uniref:FeoA family protein n=1 Tax=Helicobacter sp. 16-1353 TaxID=2004996 RepID=UPI000DCBFDE2|nr:FeoA family protein [Helicobacter sp. 16-1353]RAX51787.1 hypothetical protein CCY99_08280 [Helicobacter sp. 16-1353]